MVEDGSVPDPWDLNDTLVTDEVVGSVNTLRANNYTRKRKTKRYWRSCVP